ncbi:hypothetical protein [Pseudalgibacter alginicilyticus]|nr:hypothetical protein [Pseudalgibacter alginicilyticus]
MKTVGLHALSHDHDQDHALHCVVCDYATAQNLTPILAPDLQGFIIENTEFVLKTEITNNYSFAVSSTIATNQLFCRPPPFLF